jgi:uncharacterized protein
MDQREIVEKLTRYKELVAMHFDIEMLILFGSHAKGTANEDSDIDVAVVVKKINTDFGDYAPLLWKLRRQIDSRIEPVLIEKDYDPGGFLQEILSSGCIIH